MDEVDDVIDDGLFCSIGSPDTIITDDALRHRVYNFLRSRGMRDDVLIVPPDYTRYHSRAGTITRYVAEYYDYVPRRRDRSPCDDSRDHGDDDEGEDVEDYDDDGNGKDAHVSDVSSADPPPPPAATTAISSETAIDDSHPVVPPVNIRIIPALGTHQPMTPIQLRKMFGDGLSDKRPSPFVVHDWREGVVTIGHVPAEMVRDATHGMVNEPWPAQLNSLVWEKRMTMNDHDATTCPSSESSPSSSPSSSIPPPRSSHPLVLSIGQVVPHEVLGMANYNKNLFVGVGGVEAINLSHFIGAVHGMEKLMGRGRNPLRSILNHASEQFLKDNIDLWYILTVMGTDERTGRVVMRGLYIGNDVRCYDAACDLSLRVNFNLLDRPPKRVVVYLNEEYRSTWLGNKSIYRTRMAIDDGGELIVLAPYVETFGEDERIDRLIRQVGYAGTPAIMRAMGEDGELKNNLSAVAHLIHGSSEGRFAVRYCPGKLTRAEIESVGFEYSDLSEMTRRYDVNGLRDGWNTETDEIGDETEFYYISNPALGLWAVSSRFEADAVATSSPGAHADEGTGIISGNQRGIDMSGGVGGWKQPPPV